MSSIGTPKPEDFGFRRPVEVCLGQAPSLDPELFVGRDPELDRMRGILKPGDESRGQRRLVIRGAGGMGKTQLALAYARRTSYKSVLWFNAATEASLKDSFRTMAKAIFEVQDLELLETDQAVTRVRRWLSDTKNTQWLLIFDNYDDPKQFKIQDYYPFTDQGAIIVTTRLSELVAAKDITLQPLKNIGDSLRILQTRCRRETTLSGKSSAAMDDIY